MPTARLLVTFAMDEASRAVIEDGAGADTDVVCLDGLAPPERAAALRSADVVLARNTEHELREGEAGLLGGARLLQFVSAGVDFIPLGGFPSALPVAVNAGAYAEPMAEHALALSLAAAKRLLVEHRNLERGEFNQFVPNRMLAGRVAGILGFGGIGVASARLYRAIGMRVHAVNRRGASDEPVDWIGTTEQLDALLEAADVLLLSLPLTERTRGLLGARELRLMKPDAILVNLARGEIVDEDALYRHLRDEPDFTACIDAWWVEPVRHGEFRMDRPFLDLPNVIASPHNSASTEGWMLTALGRAVDNCRRALAGEAPLHVLAPEDRVA